MNVTLFQNTRSYVLFMSSYSSGRNIVLLADLSICVFPLALILPINCSDERTWHHALGLVASVYDTLFLVIYCACCVTISPIVAVLSNLGIMIFIRGMVVSWNWFCISVLWLYTQCRLYHVNLLTQKNFDISYLTGEIHLSHIISKEPNKIFIWLFDW